MPVIPLINPKQGIGLSDMKNFKSKVSVKGFCKLMKSDEQRKAKKSNPSKRWYVGKMAGTSKFSMFQSEVNPTDQSHGHIYSYAIGPFSTRLGATIMARHGYNNPHIQTVSQAEALARRGTSWLLSQGFHV